MDDILEPTDCARGISARCWFAIRPRRRAVGGSYCPALAKEGPIELHHVSLLFGIVCTPQSYLGSISKGPLSWRRVIVREPCKLTSKCSGLGALSEDVHMSAEKYNIRASGRSQLFFLLIKDAHRRQNFRLLLIS